MDNKQRELIILYLLCGIELKDDRLFYEKGSNIPFTGYKVAYGRKLFGLVKTSTKRAEMSFKNGKHHGPMKLWHQNGNKWLEIEYYEGKPHGLRRRWHENGDLEEEALFEYGKMIEYKYIPNNQVLHLFLDLYNKRLNQMGIGSVLDKKDKKSIESFLVHEYDIFKERLKNATESDNVYQEMFFRKVVYMIENYKTKIIEYVNNNV